MTEWNQYRGNYHKTATIDGLEGPARKPTEAWTVELRGPVRCPPVVDQDTVFVGTAEGNLTALDFQGRRRWVFETTAPTTLAPAVSGYHLLFAANDTLYALESTTGALEWKRPIEGLYTTPPTVVGEILLIGSNEGVLALELETGDVLWRAALESPPVGSQAIDSEQVYVGTQNETMHALELASGEPVWDVPTDGTVVGGPTLIDDRVYVADTQGTMLALDVETGQSWFSYSIRDPFLSTPTVLEDTVFVAASDGYVHVTDTMFGKRKLRGLLFSKRGLGLDGEPTTDPIIVGDVCCVGDSRGSLYGIDATDPDFTWHVSLEAAISRTPAVAGGSRDTTGRLFIGCEDRRLRCLEW